MGAGKTTAANAIMRAHNVTRVPFAAPLKLMLEAVGVPLANLYGDQDDKAKPLDVLCGKSARHAMQTLGTEWGRQCIGPDFWARAWCSVAAQHPEGVVADDVRFPNEAEAIRSLGGLVICIVPSKFAGAHVKTGHASEDFAKIPRDALIVNDGSKRQLGVEIRRALRLVAAR